MRTLQDYPNNFYYKRKRLLTLISIAAYNCEKSFSYIIQYLTAYHKLPA